MPCYSPLLAYQCGNGDIVFNENKSKDVRRQLELACGQCIGCKLERSRRWAVRGTHEASLYEANSFITLTYNDENLPRGGTLVVKHTQDFLKRARHHIGPFRYYLCGEYGETTWRPHYHAIIFGKDWMDKKPFSTTDTGDKTYTSERLEQIWGMGQCLTAAVTFNSIAYVTRYCTQVRNGRQAEPHYRRYNEWGKSYYLEPEFGNMSRKPGIGKEWLNKYHTDVYTTDEVIINGKKGRPPKFYDEQYKRMFPDNMEQIKERREIDAYERREDNTPERLRVKEQVTRAAITQLQRGKI